MAAPLRIRAGSPAHRAYQLAGWTLLAGAVVLIPVVFSQSKVVLFSQVAAFSIAILGLNIVTGYSGQVSLGHSAFMGVGAYTTAILVADHSWSYFTTIPVAALICFTVGVLVGIPALRLKGLYLALATLGLAAIFPKLVNKLESITGGSNGKNIPVRRVRLNAPGWTGLKAREDGYIWVYMILVAFAAVLFLLARNMIRSRSGRALLALRDNAIGAEVSGVDLARYKVLAFGISAAYAGIAGSLFMFTVTNATGTAYSLNRSIELLTGVVIGGLASLPGSLLGGLVVIFLPDWAKDWGDGTLAGAVYGVAIIVIIAVYPSGVAGLLRRVRSFIVEIAPMPHEPQAPTAPVREAVEELTDR
jgi:branched-chain amino acid transport system permease protein